MHTESDLLRDGLIEQVLLERDQLAEQILARLRAEMPVFEPLPSDQLLPGVTGNIEHLLGALRTAAPPADLDLEAFADHGRLRAAQGVPVGDLLHGWRLGANLLVEELTRVGRAGGVSDAILLELAADLHRASDRVMVTVTQAHREEELARAGSERDRRTDLVRGVLYGTLNLSAIHVQAEVYGLDTERPYRAIRARPTEELPAVELERRLGLARGTGRPSGLGALIDGDLAGFIDRPPARELDVAVGIGPAVSLDHLEDSFRLATRALATAAAFGLRGLYDLRRLGVRPAILTDPEVGEELERQYIEPLAAAGDSAPTLAETAERYIATGMRIEATAKEMFVHPNTLRYRLKRFEELTACDLRDPYCILGVWWALQRWRLGQKPGA